MFTMNVWTIVKTKDTNQIWKVHDFSLSSQMALVIFDPVWEAPTRKWIDKNNLIELS